MGASLVWWFRVGLQGQVIWAPSLTRSVCEAGCFTSLIRGTGVMRVSEPSDHGEDSCAQNPEWYCAMEKGGSQLEAEAPSCPLLSEP